MNGSHFWSKYRRGTIFRRSFIRESAPAISMGKIPREHFDAQSFIGSYGEYGSCNMETGKQGQN